MTIEPITKEEFGALPHAPHALSPEVAALVALPLGKGIKFPCRWKHLLPPKTGCTGISLFHQTSKLRGFKITMRCYNHVVYIWKLSKGGKKI